MVFVTYIFDWYVSVMICSGLSGKMLTLTLWKKTCVFVSVSIRILFVCFFPICVCAHIAFVCVCFVNEKVCVIVSRCPDINGSLRKGHCLHPPCVSFANDDYQHQHQHHSQVLNLNSFSSSWRAHRATGPLFILRARKLAISGENLLPQTTAGKISLNARS